MHRVEPRVSPPQVFPTQGLSAFQKCYFSVYNGSNRNEQLSSGSSQASRCLPCDAGPICRASTLQKLIELALSILALWLFLWLNKGSVSGNPAPYSLWMPLLGDVRPKLVCCLFWELMNGKKPYTNCFVNARQILSHLACCAMRIVRQHTMS